MFKSKVLTLILMFMMISVPASGAKFIPEQPVIPVHELKPGMSGYMLTVIKGTEPSKIPLKIISIIPQKPGKSMREAILIKILGGTKLAQGMSGSPVFVQGRLAGAIRSGWEQSDQTLALAVPIEAMCSVFDFEENAVTSTESLALMNLSLSGLSVNNPSISELSQKIGVTFTQGMNANSGNLTAGTMKLKPGDSLAGILVWGDVELSAIGTLTATAKDGRFLAFGHDFLKRGTSAYPSAGAVIHEIVNSSSFPFKLATTSIINGTITQDREAAVGGRFGYYAPSVSCEFIFRDLDRKTEDKYKFRTIADDFLTDKLIDGILSGLAEELWGRKGQGTMSVNLRIDGRNIPNGWARRDIFFSESNIASEAFKQAKTVINAFLTQPFSETFPAGFTVTVEATQLPKVLIIEDVETVSDAEPGSEIEISVKLRGWRTEPVTRKFKMKIPEDSSGVVEVIVRGGGVQSFPQTAVDEGLKSITSLERLLTEFKAADGNNQLIIELNTDRMENIIQNIRNKRKSSAKSKSEGRQERMPDFLPEEEEYLSETKERRIKEGTLKIYNSDYFIDGLMKRIIHVEK